MSKVNTNTGKGKIPKCIQAPLPLLKGCSMLPTLVHTQAPEKNINIATCKRDHSMPNENCKVYFNHHCIASYDLKSKTFLIVANPPKACRDPDSQEPGNIASQQDDQNHNLFRLRWMLTWLCKARFQKKMLPILKPNNKNTKPSPLIT